MGAVAGMKMEPRRDVRLARAEIMSYREKLIRADEEFRRMIEQHEARWLQAVRERVHKGKR